MNSTRSAGWPPVASFSERVEAALGDLSEVQREALHLYVVDEQPYLHVAARLGVSEPAARARVSRGLRALRRFIAPRGEEHR